jgi:PAS domain S-box-containing protein
MDKAEALLLRNQQNPKEASEFRSPPIENLTIPATYNKIIFLENGKPLDYTFVEVNKAFEELVGSKRELILGRRFSEIPQIQEEDSLFSERMEIYCDVSTTGIPLETEKYVRHFQKWFHLYLYSPQKGYFLELMQDISQRKTLEENLRLNNSGLKNLISPENGLWLLDEKGITVYVNTKMASLLGYPKDHFIGKTLASFLVQQSKANAAAEGLPFKLAKPKWIELQFTHNLGTIIFTLAEASPINNNGHSAGVILNVTDISSRKLAEQELSKNQRKYSGLFQHMTDGFAYCQVLFDQDGEPVELVFSDINTAFKHLMNLGDKPVLGRKVSDVFPHMKNEYAGWIQIYRKLSRNGKNFKIEKYFEGLDRWFIVHAYCPEPGYFAIVFQDITERKKTEKQLKQSEKQYKKLANSITDLFFAVDSSLHFTYWNWASEKFTAITAQNALGRHVYEVFGRDKTARKAVKTYLEVMRTRRAQTFTDKLCRGDQNITFEMRVYPTGNGISVFARDVTERKRLQEALEQYTAHLETLVKIRTERLRGVERLATIGETAGMIGHDIRNPLQSIIGEVYLAKEELNDLQECPVKQSLTESVHCIEEQVTYINKIVTDLQDYAKPLTPTFQEVQLEDAIKDVLENLDSPSNIKVSYTVEKPFPSLIADASFIKRILTNLALNGIQAMQESGGELTINAFPRSKTAIIAVSDTGVGIPEEVVSKIFKPLFTTKSKGQGFGLAVVKKLVEALNGDVSFETKTGKGTTFILEIPLNAQP